MSRILALLLLLAPASAFAQGLDVRAIPACPVGGSGRFDWDPVNLKLVCDTAALPSAGVSSFNTRMGAIALISADVTTALGFTPLSAALTSFNTRTGPAITLLSADVVTALGFTPLSAALTSFNTRTGPSITLLSADVTGALGFTPLSAALTSFNSRSGPAITLTSADVTGALTFTPENAANKGAASGYAPLDPNSKVPLANLPAALDQRGITLAWVGVPGASQVAQTVLNVPCTITANFAGSQSWLGTLPTATANFALSYIHSGSSNAIGNAVLSTSSHVAAYPTTGAISLVAGDVLVGTAPATPDATAADLALTANCTLPTP